MKIAAVYIQNSTRSTTVSHEPTDGLPYSWQADIKVENDKNHVDLSSEMYHELESHSERGGSPT